VTGDVYNFKVPTQRSIALTAPYFHTGSVRDLRQAVEVMANAQLGTMLIAPEIDRIKVFLDGLTGVWPSVVLPILSGGGGPRQALMATGQMPTLPQRRQEFPAPAPPAGPSFALQPFALAQGAFETGLFVEHGAITSDSDRG